MLWTYDAISEIRIIHFQFIQSNECSTETELRWTLPELQALYNIKLCSLNHAENKIYMYNKQASFSSYLSRNSCPWSPSIPGNDAMSFSKNLTWQSFSPASSAKVIFFSLFATFSEALEPLSANFCNWWTEMIKMMPRTKEKLYKINQDEEQTMILQNRLQSLDIMESNLLADASTLVTFLIAILACHHSKLIDEHKEFMRICKIKGCSSKRMWRKKNIGVPHLHCISRMWQDRLHAVIFLPQFPSWSLTHLTVLLQDIQCHASGVVRMQWHSLNRLG